ncbi:hypothetical protein HID58_080562 [Brassica napus]|uniref:Ubiquitin-like domain-containing protein n=1 Tax=Brassica napus TaxID=3708 RepID=A0ABQ7Y821_BRANA|nr:hypothetical protein HID58_080562 [Brassica napus]
MGKKKKKKMKTTSVELRRKRKVGDEKFVKGKLDIWWTLHLSSSSSLTSSKDPKPKLSRNTERKSLLFYLNDLSEKSVRLLGFAFNEVSKSTDMPEEESVDIKFRLYDGSDIGPFHYSSSSTVDFLKQRVVSDWPKGKTVVPKGINEVKLISSGKILENSKTVGQCKTPFGEVAGGVTVMHVVVQPSLAKTKTEKKVDKAPKAVICTCTIL